MLDRNTAPAIQKIQKINFDILANVPLYKNANQKDYNIIKLKMEKP